MSAPANVFTSGVLEWQYVDVFFPVANVEIPISHALTGEFVGWSVIGKSEFCDIKDGQVPSARTSLQLVSDTANVLARIRVEAVRIPPR